MLIIGWGSWSQRAARVAPRDNVEVPPHPGRIRSHPRMINPSILLQLQQTGDENGNPAGRYRPTRCGNPNPTSWLLIGWGSWSQRAARERTQDFAYERGRDEAAARGLAAVGKLTEIVEVENETWQGAKFGVC